MEPDPPLSAAPKTVLTPAGEPNSKSMHEPHPISRMPSDSPLPPNHPPSAGDWEHYTPSLEVQDLRPDRLLATAPRISFKGQQVPVLGGIPILVKLGQGGMGAVYFGIHPRLKQEVAVKVLPFPLLSQNPNMLERFYREAQIAAKVKSPRVVGVLDVNEEHGLFYLVMDYIAGLSAGGYVKRHFPERMLPESTALDICISATEGLQAAHEEGVIHRDIKPDNILLPRGKSEGEFNFKQSKLADLGLARSEESGASLTGVNSAMGTPGFMAPEQALDAKTARKPADLFSMGATLYDLLCGQPPFIGDSLTKVIIATLSEDYAPVTNFRSDVSKETLAVLDRCLKKEPAERYYDAGELLEALRAARWKASTNQPVPPVRLPANALSAKATVARPHLPLGPHTVPGAAQAVPAAGPVPGTPYYATATANGMPHAPAPAASSFMPESNPSDAYTPTLVKPGGTGMLRPAGSRSGAPKVPAQPLFYNPPRKKSSSMAPLYLGGALLCAAGIAFALLHGDSFQKDRDQLLSQTEPLLNQPNAELAGALQSLKDFDSKYVSRSPEDLQPVQDLEIRFMRTIEQRKNAADAAHAGKTPTNPDKTTQPEPEKKLSPDEVVFQRALTDAKTAYTNKDLKGAEALLLKALTVHPTHKPTNDNLDLVRREMQNASRPNSDTPNADAASALDQPVKEALEELQNGNYKHAERILTRAMEETPAGTAHLEDAKKVLNKARRAQKAESLLTDAQRYIAGNKFADAREAYAAARTAYFESPLKERIEAGYLELEAKAKEAGKQEQYERYMNEGRKAMDDGHFQGAAALFNQALQAIPGDTAAMDARREAMQRLLDSRKDGPPPGQGQPDDNTSLVLPPPPGTQPNGSKPPPPPGGRRPAK